MRPLHPTLCALWGAMELPLLRSGAMCGSQMAPRGFGSLWGVTVATLCIYMEFIIRISISLCLYRTTPCPGRDLSVAEDDVREARVVHPDFVLAPKSGG